MSVTCGSCGGIAADETAEDAVATGQIVNGVVSPYPAPQPRWFGRCDECGTRRAVCLVVMEKHPAVRLRLGSLSYAVDRLDSAVSILDATKVNVGLDNIERLTASESDLWGLLEMADVGDRLSWRNQMVPVQSDLRPTGTRWGWVSDEVQTVVNQAVALYFRRRLEVPEPVGPPPGGARGCLVCGRQSHLIKASLQQRVWGGIRWIIPKLVGGSGDTPISGYCCGICTPSLPPLGAGQEIKLRDVQRALLRYVGAGDEYLQYEFGMTAWAVSGAKPVVEAWSWLDCSDLAEEMKPKPQGKVWIEAYSQR